MNGASNITSFTVTYKNGHFYTKENKRLIFAERKEYVVIGSPSDFLDTDEMFDTHPARKSEVMKSTVVNKYGEENTIYMLSQGTRFRFQFGLGKKKKDVPQRRYEFEGVFKEDVYLYKINNAPSEIPESWRIEDCVTCIDKCIDGSFNLSEPIIAESPNSAFAMLIGTHFDRQRTTSIKIYGHFWVELEANTTISPTRDAQRLTLGQLRIKLLNENIERIVTMKKEKAKKSIKNIVPKLKF